VVFVVVVVVVLVVCLSPPEYDEIEFLTKLQLISAIKISLLLSLHREDPG
jgi:hypothetical protein